MRRREGQGVPARLATFDADDWPDFAAWVDARRAWADENGWPDPDDGPDGLDAIRQTPDEPWDQSKI